MTNARITANLPSRNFDVTQAFYKRLGFDLVYRGETWMILERDGAWAEFFPHPDLDPKESWFSACLRLPEIDGLHAEWLALDIGEKDSPFPNIGKEAFTLDGAPRMFTLGDPDGSLWRVLEMGDDW